MCLTPPPQSDRCRFSVVHRESTSRHRHLPCGEIVDRRIFFSHYGYQCNLFRCVDLRVSLPKVALDFFFHATGAIAWRIFPARNALTQGGMRSLSPIIFAIIESSALYALAILSAFICLLTGCQWEHPAVGAIIPFVVSPDMPSASFSRKT